MLTFQESLTYSFVTREPKPKFRLPESDPNRRLAECWSQRFFLWLFLVFKEIVVGDDTAHGCPANFFRVVAWQHKNVGSMQVPPCLFAKNPG